MPATARWCERAAHASISSRDTPASTAAFQPTVIDMSMLGAAGVSRWLGDIQSAHSFVPLLRRSERGDVDIECVAACDHDAIHAGANRGRGGRDRGQAGRTVSIDRSAGHVFDARLDRHVAGDVAAAVQRLGDHDVVDQRGIEPGPPQRGDDHVLGQRERVDVDQRALVGAADRRPRRRDDHGIRHGPISR